MGKSFFVVFAISVFAATAFAKGVSYVPGLVPLTDGPGLYGSSNTRAAAYDALAPAVTLPVRVNVVGASTTKLLFPALPTAAHDPDVLWGNCGFPKQYGEVWANPSASVWSQCNSAGFPDPQVVVVKIGDSRIASGGPALDAQTLRAIVENAFAKWPTLKQVYLVDEGWMGYYSAEPTGGYNHGLGIKQAVGGYLANPTRFVAWGAYLWANGLGPDRVAGGIPGRADGLEWLPSDYQSDGLHQSPQGAAKQANLIVSALRSDPVASLWIDGS